MMQQPIHIKTMEDARKILQGQLVSIAFTVEADGGQFVTLSNVGLFERIGQENVYLIMPVLGNGHSSIGRMSYPWSAIDNHFSINPKPDEYIEKTSPDYDLYTKLLGVAD